MAPPGAIEGDATVFTQQPEHLRRSGGGGQKPGQLNEEQLREFYEKGFVVLKDFFPPEELEPCLRAIESLVERLAEKLYEGGKIKSLYKDLDVYKRLSALENEFPGSNILMHKMGVLPEELRSLWTNHRLLNMMEQIVGPDIAGHPVWNLRTKTPQSEAATVPWHQDNAYLDDDVASTMIPTAWIPLLDVDEIHGCLEFMSRGHRSGKLVEHVCCAGDTWYVEMVEGEAEKTLGVDLTKDLIKTPIKYGSFILFNNLIPHRSLDNFSDKVRWSLDLRWQDPNKPYGFHGLKQGVVMRLGGQPPPSGIDWDGLTAENRHTISLKVVEEDLKKAGYKEKDFDTAMAGPWMSRWKIAHHNRHTKSLDTTKGTSWH